MSGHHGFRKHDVRIFLRACEDLDVSPAECIMVGDRIDNDIYPAKLLGMGTVLFRTAVTATSNLVRYATCPMRRWRMSKDSQRRLTGCWRSLDPRADARFGRPAPQLRARVVSEHILAHDPAPGPFGFEPGQ